MCNRSRILWEIIACYLFFFSLTGVACRFTELLPLHLPSFDSLQQTLVHLNLSPEQLIANAMEKPWVAKGGNADVYAFPGSDDFVIRAPRFAVNAFKETGGKLDLHAVADYAPDINLGQPVATIGPYQILKKQTGKPAGLPYGYDRKSPPAVEAANHEYAERTKEAAEMPEDSYLKLANQIKWLNDHAGKVVDPSKAGNLLIDAKGKCFNLVDLNPKNPDYKNSAEELVIMLIDNAHHDKLTDSPEVTRQRQQIIERALRAGKKAGLGFRRESSSLDYSWKIAKMAGSPGAYWDSLSN